MEQEKFFFSRFSPKTNYFLGLGSALVLALVIGFFVLLSLVLDGSQSSKQVAGTQVGNNPEAAAPAPAPGQGAIQLAEITDSDWVRGDKNAKVTIVEFSDLECPFCQRFHPTMQRLMDEYNGQVRWVYRHFPLASLHSKAPKEAEAAECAGELGGNDGFWKFVDRLFEITPANNGLDPAQLPVIAEYAGLNRSQFAACLDSGKYAQKVQEQYQQAVTAGGQGTPYSIVVTTDGEKTPVSGAVPYEQLKAAVDQALKN